MAANPFPSPSVLALYRFRNLFNAVKSRLTETRPDLTTNEVSLLLNLHRPRRIKDLARIMVCQPSNVTPLVNRCQERGWVAKKRSEQDARTINVELSEPGIALRNELVTEIEKHILDISGISSESFDAILKLMPEEI